MRITSDLGVRTVGVDPSSVAVERCLACGLDALSGEASDLARLFSSKRFDTITLNHVLEHMPNPVSGLVDLASVLRRGGRMVVAVPNAGYWAC